MGVDIDRFWTMTPKTLDPYFKAFSLQRKREDEAMWIQGMYIAMAVGSVLSSEAEYPKRSFIAQQELEQDKELLAQSKMELMRQKMVEHMLVINRGLDKKGG